MIIETKSFLKIINNYQYSYIVNSFYLSSLFISFIIIGEKEISIKIIFLTSFSTFLTSLLSANIRNVSLSDRNFKNLNANINFRLIASIFILIISIITYVYIFDENFSFFLLFANIIVFYSWLLELIIAKIELSKKNNLVKFNYLFYLIVIFNIGVADKDNYEKTFLCLIIFKLFFLFFFLKKLNFSLNFNLNNIFIKNEEIKKNLPSSLALTFLNLLIKVSLYQFYKYNDLDLIYLSLSIYSLPGSIIVNSYGTSFLSYNKKTPFLFIILRYVIVLTIIISASLNIIGLNFNIPISNLNIDIYYLLIISISSMFQALGQSFRVIRMSNFHNRNQIIRCDLLFSFLSTINIFIFILLLQDILIYFIPINSLICLFIYFNAFRINYKI